MTFFTRHLENFEQLILDAFDNLIKVYNLKFVSKSDEFGNEALFVNPQCELRFTYDRGEFGCVIIHPKTKNKYLAALVYDLLYPKDVTYDFSPDIKPEIIIKQFADLFHFKLESVLKGDFSWAAAYEEKF